MEIDAETIQSIGNVLNALEALGGKVRIRTLTFDCKKYNWSPRHRVRIVGERSRYGNAVRVTKIETLD